jgi:hypothetical protein
MAASRSAAGAYRKKKSLLKLKWTDHPKFSTSLLQMWRHQFFSAGPADLNNYGISAEYWSLRRHFSVVGDDDHRDRRVIRDDL